ncbi:MAG TPA: FAD:protein FMN transferase [Opitutaceae bacterium]|nr:FAD:protein FMN transferase [Opitutaceae bacterium]
MPNEPPRKLSFPALGTQCEVQYFAPEGGAQAAAFEQRVVAWVQAFERKYSRFRDDSLISRINAAAGAEWVAVDAEAEQLFLLCDTVYRMTQGAMDPTALPLLRLWNYKVQPATLPAPEAIAAARAKVGWPRVRREPGRVFLPEPGMALDLGGFGKEFAVDQVAMLAPACRIPAALVDFGHDLRAVGVPPGRPAWHVGLEDPHQPGKSSGSIALFGGRGVASSGDYIRHFFHGGRRYGHIVDPRSGYPVANGCDQATVIAGTCLQAGVLSTTAFILGIPAGADYIQGFPGAEGLLVGTQGRAQTRGFFNYVVA